MAPQVKFVGTVSVRLTVPVNPPIAVIVIVDVAEVPALTAAGEVAWMVKSLPKLKVAVAECDKVPLVPVMTTAKVPELAVQVSVAVPELVTLVGVIAPQVNPAGILSVSDIVPVNPLTAVMVIVEVRLEPTLPEGEVAAIVKSVTVKAAVAECDNVPLVPVTVTT
jgi:hypothetical protein